MARLSTPPVNDFLCVVAVLGVHGFALALLVFPYGHGTKKDETQNKK
jgi:hypothetical protein